MGCNSSKTLLPPLPRYSAYALNHMKATTRHELAMRAQTYLKKGPYESQILAGIYCAGAYPHHCYGPIGDVKPMLEYNGYRVDEVQESSASFSHISITIPPDAKQPVSPQFIPNGHAYGKVPDRC